ncbi:MAG TPA: AraC family transcriptional regulator [Cytophagales bacterium]|nr:AraC family transcriptional regulator [Cytophagales bacterium]
MSDIIHIESIAQTYAFLGAGAPPHPQITVMRQWPRSSRDHTQLTFTSDLYYLALKHNISGSFQYGRSRYDYQEGTLVFIGPGQVATFTVPQQERDSQGWVILFHPDLIRSSELGKTIHQYSFFKYDTNEALHLAEKEKQFLNALVDTIEQEIHQNMDRHSQDLMVQNLETILKYSARYYDRQFYTRTPMHQGILAQFDDYLRGWFATEDLSEKCIPTVEDCGQALHMSGSYLSDLLRTETGRSAKDHIYGFLIERAKTALLNPSHSVSEIAYTLGFDYPQNFSKLFKSKTGMSPKEFRSQN